MIIKKDQCAIKLSLFLGLSFGRSSSTFSLFLFVILFSRILLRCLSEGLDTFIKFKNSKFYFMID